MTPEDLARLQELESLLEDEYGDELSEMDEDDRAELKDLRSEARDEKRRAKTLAKFDKARTVFKVTTPESRLKDGITWNTRTGDDALDFEPTGEYDICYTLDLATAQRLAVETSSIDEIDRKTLSGEFSFVEGMDERGMIPCYVADEATP